MAEYKVVPVHDRRIDLHKDGEKVGYLDFHEGIGSFYLDYVYVEPEFRGQEIGVEIVRAGIRLAREKNLAPKPICGYAGTIMKRNRWPEEFEG